MKSSQKGFIVPLLIIIAVLLLLGGLYFYKNTAQTIPAPIKTSTTTTSSITDKSLFVGDWEGDSTPVANTKYNFNTDGSVTYSNSGKNPYSIVGTWNINHDLSAKMPIFPKAKSGAPIFDKNTIQSFENNYLEIQLAGRVYDYGFIFSNSNNTLELADLMLGDITSYSRANLTSTNTSKMGEVTIQKIIIPTGIDFSQKAQDYPFDIRIAQGHYLLLLSQSANVETLIYDGKGVGVGSVVSYGLSNNGLHYIYSINNGDVNDLYIDGKKITSAQNLGADTNGVSVANNGKDYFYKTSSHAQGVYPETLFKDDNKIFTAPQGFLGFSISDDGSHYAAALRNIVDGSLVTSVIVNGKEVLKQDGELGDVLISEDGLHYAYVLPPSMGSNMNTLIIDGTQQIPLFNPDEAIVKNYLDKNTTHTFKYVSYDTTGNIDWLLDGKKVTIDNPSSVVPELYQNTLNLFTLVK